MRSHARLVVVGGGIIGCSILYRLARLGWSDIVLVEKNELTAGVTWHSSGHVMQVEEDTAIARISNLSFRLYTALEAETGQAVGLHKSGTIRLATSKARLERYKKLTPQMRLLGIPFEVIGPDDIKRRFPLTVTDGLLGGAWTPDEGHLDPSMATQAFAHGARKGGAEINRHTMITGMSRANGEWRVETTKGTITAEIVVLATGFWAPDIAARLGVRLPILTVQRQYLITEPVAEIRELGFELPIFHDYDAPFYFRQERESLMMGVYEPHVPYCFVEGIPPDFGQELLPSDLERSAACIDAGIRRVPIMGRLGIKRVVCGPTSRTPDFQGLIGPVPGLQNFFVAAGFSAGVVQGAAIGQLMAEWIVEGEPSLDVSSLDVSRFGPYADKRYIRSILSEAHSYGSLDPNAERKAGRPGRSSPLYDRHMALGATFTPRLGWECPAWFPRADAAEESAAVAAECRAVHEHCGVFDLTSFAKYEVSGSGAAAYLAKLLGHGLPEADGAVVSTVVASPSGRAEARFTTARLAGDRFYLTSSPEAQYHHLRWLLLHLPDDSSIKVEDLTGRYGSLLLAGPAARRVLQGLSDAKLDNDRFPWRVAREIQVGYAPVRALRFSPVGELAWELHCPIEYLAPLHGSLMAEGAANGIADAGLKAFDALRLEKAWPLWGSELTSEVLTGPAPAAVKTAKRLACLSIPFGPGETATGLVLLSNGKPVGLVRSSAYGHRTGIGIAIAHLDPGLPRSVIELDCEIAGTPRFAKVVDGPLYDPEDARVQM